MPDESAKLRVSDVLSVTSWTRPKLKVESDDQTHRWTHNIAALYE